MDESLPIVELSAIPDLRWVLARGQYLPQPGSSEVLVGAALWAVTSHLRRDGHFPADKLSQLNKEDKGPIGLVRGVKAHTEGRLLLEIWFLEERVQPSEESAGQGEEPEAAAGAQDRGRVGQGGDGHAEVDREAEVVEDGGEQGLGRRRRRRRMAGQRRGSRVSQGSGRDSHGVNEDALSEIGGSASMQTPPSEPASASPAATPEGSGAAPQTRSLLSGCLLASSSPHPVPVQDVELSMQGYPASTARSALLVVDCVQLAAALCTPKRVQSALGGAQQGSSSPANGAAIAVALAILLAEEANAGRAAAGMSVTAERMP